MKNRTNKNFIVSLMSLVVVLLLLSAAAIVRDGKLFGFDLRDGRATEHGRHDVQASTAALTANNDTLTVMPDGAIVVNTRLLAKDVQGYGGQVPLRIHIDKGGVVDSIEAEPNAESPDFFNHASSLFGKWQGKTVDEAMAEEVDAVTGATFSSRAIIANVQRGLAYAKRHAELDKESEADSPDSDAIGSAGVPGASASAKGLDSGRHCCIDCGAVGCCCSAIRQNRRWHCVQLALNVIVLGLWTGTFVSYTLLMRLFSGGRKPCHARHARRSVAYGSGGYALSFGRSTRTLLRPRVPVRFGSRACRQTHPSQTAALATLEQSAQRVPQRSVGSAYGAHAHLYVDRMDGLRAVHSVPLHLGFGVGNSICHIVSRPLDMGATTLLQVRLSYGEPFLGVRNFEF